MRVFSLVSFENLPFASRLCWYRLRSCSPRNVEACGSAVQGQLWLCSKLEARWGYIHKTYFYTYTYKLCIHAYHIYANLKIRPIPGGVPNYPRDVYIRAD